MPKRRANHEGTIYKRRDGRWVAALVLPDGRRKSYYGKTRQEVAQKLTAGLKATQDGLPIPSEQLKVERYLQDWLQSIKASVRASTWYRYDQLIRLHALPALGQLALARLEPRHLQRLYTDCLARGQAPASVRQLHAVLRRALGQAVKWGNLPRNVAALVNSPRIWCSPTKLANQWTLGTCATGRCGHCLKKPDCPVIAFTICATRRQHSCWARACMPRLSARCLGTAASGSH
jgi:integrase